MRPLELAKPVVLAFGCIGILASGGIWVIGGAVDWLASGIGSLEHGHFQLLFVILSVVFVLDLVAVGGITAGTAIVLKRFSRRLYRRRPMPG